MIIMIFKRNGEGDSEILSARNGLKNQFGN
jgi:hypothetical protein